VISSGVLSTYRNYPFPCLSAAHRPGAEPLPPVPKQSLFPSNRLRTGGH